MFVIQMAKVHLKPMVGVSVRRTIEESLRRMATSGIYRYHEYNDRMEKADTCHNVGKVAISIGIGNQQR